MKKFIIVLFCFTLLTGCGQKQAAPAPTAAVSVPATEAPATEPVPAQTSPSETATEPVAESAPAETSPEEVTEPPAAAEAEEFTPYTLSLHSFVSIFDAPTYDGCYTASVGEDGVYTIVEEKADEEGNLWGRLKSGIGWVCLTDLQTELPVRAGLASEKVLESPHHLVIVDNSEYMEYLVFRSTQPLTDVRLTALLPDVGGYKEDCTYETLSQLTPEKPLVAEVVFYGDFTTYGLSFTDEAGTQRQFAVYISGRNSAPILQEYTN